MLAPLTHFRATTTIRRSRMLPVEGNVRVELGARVSPGDTIARSKLSHRHLMLDASRSLGVPVERVQSLMQRQVGEQVEKGAIIAKRRGLAARLLRAPEDGMIAAVNQGQILLKVSDASSKLPARLPGEVIDIEPGRGVIIECVCAWIQGVWGNNRFADGILHLVSGKGDHMLNASEIDLSQRGVILVAGHCNQQQALELAAQVPIRGLILGSLATHLLPIAEKLDFPILLVEGFGEIPMNELALGLLRDHAGKEATINAQAQDVLKDQRPEILIPLEDAGNPPSPVELQSFRIGQTVRILRAPHIGKIGEITALLPHSTRFPSGIRAPGAEVALSTEGVTRVPLANLEVLG